MVLAVPVFPPNTTFFILILHQLRQWPTGRQGPLLSVIMVFFPGPSTLKSGKPRPPKVPLLDLGKEDLKRKEERKLERGGEEKEQQLAEGETKEEDDEELAAVNAPSGPPSTYIPNAIPTYNDAMELKPHVPPPALTPREVMIKDLPLPSLLTMPKPLLLPLWNLAETSGQSTPSHEVVPRFPKLQLGQLRRRLSGWRSTPSPSAGAQPPMPPPSEPSSDMTEPDWDESDPDDEAPPYTIASNDEIQPQARTTFTLRGRYVYRDGDQTTPVYQTSLPVQRQSPSTRYIDFSRVEFKPVTLPDETPVVFPAYRPRRLYEMERSPFFYQSKKTGGFKTGYNMSLKGRGSVGVGREIAVSKHWGVQHKGYRAETKWTEKDLEDCDSEDGAIEIQRGLRALKEFLWTDSGEKVLGRQVEVSTSRGAEHKFEMLAPVVTRRFMEAMVALWTSLVWDQELERGTKKHRSSPELGGRGRRREKVERMAEHLMSSCRAKESS